MRALSPGRNEGRGCAGAVTPTEVAENVLRCIAESQAAVPPMHFFAFVDEADVRKQAALSTARCRIPSALNPVRVAPFRCRAPFPHQFRTSGNHAAL